MLHYEFERPTPQIMEAWGKWFESIKDDIVDISSIRVYEVVSN
jgi:hypothetical protein